MHKILNLLLAFCFSITTVNAASITKVINSLNINKSAVSVSIKDVSNGKEVYSLNEKTPMMPASTLKIITSASAYDVLGEDFEFSTQLYKSSNNDLYFKLSGDPFLSSTDLGNLLKSAKDKNILSPKNIYVDASIFDNVEWGEGWQWDDDLNPLMPKFSAYNLDRNLLRIEVAPTSKNLPATISTKPFYPLTFVNMVTTDYSKGSSVVLDRNNAIAPNVINANGTVAKTQNIFIPVNNPKRYFVLRLEESIRNKSFDYFNSIKNKNLPSENVYLVDEVKHGIDNAMFSILKYSDNLVAETLFKVAGSVWSNSEGSITNSLNMLNTYLENLNINTDDIKIVDGSGVSKNNIMTANFMSSFLALKAQEDDFETFRKYLPAPGEGTLKNRMLYFKENLNAKTGTLSDTSAIAGYITTRKGKVYAFDIMINDAKTSSADKKNVEEQILRQVYMSY